MSLPLALQGDVYLIEPGVARIPEFAGLKPAATIRRKKLNFTPPEGDDKFSRIRDRFEWFAIDFKGTRW